MPEFLFGFLWYQWQNKVEKPVNFAGGAVFFSGLLFCWFLFAVLLCLQGFGLDTDAWLMAQTAGRLLAGEGYDPARSFGNPAWEFLLTILQPDFEFRISNGFNLALALLFLYRLRELCTHSSTQFQWIQSAALCLLPVFTEAATSSMELMPAWYLFLEALLSLRNNRLFLFIVLSTLAAFTRPEFFIFIAVAGYHQNRKLLPKLLFPFILLLPYVWWSLGKNPAPFESLSELPRFYAGRIWFLIRQAGLLLPVYLLLFYHSLKQQNTMLIWSGRIALGFFLLFPFEWAYAFPAMLSGLIQASKDWNRKHVLWLVIISTGSSWIFPQSGLPALFKQRKQMLQQYQWMENFNPKEPTLILDGATFLPTRFNLWERSGQNRVFHKKNSLLWVAERLNKSELDSFQRTGFRICKLNRESSRPWIQDVP